jgi:hypothetical protein
MVVVIRVSRKLRWELAQGCVDKFKEPVASLQDIEVVHRSITNGNLKCSLLPVFVPSPMHPLSQEPSALAAVVIQGEHEQ